VAQHISRKELKKDEFRDSLVHGAEAVSSHRGGFGLAVTIALVVALAILGWRYYTQHQTARASFALDDAMKIFTARIRAATDPAQPGEITYIDDKAKFSDAARKFADVAGKFGRTRPGQQAHFYDAICHQRLGQYDQAAQELSTLAASGDADMQALANFQLASVDIESGKIAQAIPIYQQLMAKPTVLVPKPLVMLSLADAYSHSNPAEATKLLNQIKSEFPDSPAADEATKRLELVTGQS
jgi:predicted negative regulator of RcsB-dependent stress response